MSKFYQTSNDIILASEFWDREIISFKSSQIIDKKNYLYIIYKRIHLIKMFEPPVTHNDKTTANKQDNTQTPPKKVILVIGEDIYQETPQKPVFGIPPPKKSDIFDFLPPPDNQEIRSPTHDFIWNLEFC